MKFDDVLTRIGEFGPYQKGLYLLLCLPAIVGSVQLIQTVVFFFAVPKHRCAIPGLENDTYKVQNDAHEHLVNSTIPKDFGFYGEIKYSSCELFSFTNTSDLWSPDVTNVTVPCQEWVYDKTQYISTIAQSMDFVCDKKSLTSHVRMIAMGGLLVGSLTAGPFSDTFGRRPIIMVHTFILVLLSIVLPWVTSVPLLFITLFLINLGVMGQYLSCFVFGMEIVAPAKRMWTGILMNLFWSLGNMVVALSTFLLRDWKIRQLVVSIPAVVFVYLYFIPESPRWLLKRGRTEEAKTVVCKIAKCNKVHFNPDILDDVRMCEDNKNHEPFWNVFKSPILMRRMINLCYQWFAVALSFYGLSMNVTNLSGNIYLNFFLFVLIEMFAFVACLFVMDRVGRKRLLFFFQMTTGAACILPLVPVLVSETPNKWAIIILNIIGNTSASASFACVFAFSAELVPTSTRNSCMGLGSMCGRVGNIISPYIVDLTLYVTGRFGQILPMLVFGAIATVAGILALFLPETLNKKLPETIQDAERLGMKSNDDNDKTVPVEMVPLDKHQRQHAEPAEPERQPLPT